MSECMCSTVTINGVEYAPINKDARRLQIIVLHRGFVFVGDVERSGDEIVIHNAKNVRRWGTKTGLGELAEKGPQTNTILDGAGTVRYSPLAEICAYDCNAAKWIS